jgi:hypothetical protein
VIEKLKKASNISRMLKEALNLNTSSKSKKLNKKKLQAKSF